MRCAKALSCAISSTCELCDELCESSERWVLGCSCCAARTGKNASRLNCCGREAIETSRNTAKRWACTALPPPFCSAAACKRSKKSASKPFQMPTSSLGAALLLDERVQNFSDLDHRDASRLGGRFGVALVTLAVVDLLHIYSYRRPTPARISAEHRFRHREAP